MRFVKGFGQFWYDFIIGDDWKVAAAVVAALGSGLVLLVAGVPEAAVAVLTALLLGAAFTIALVIDVRARQAP